jgi:hypothetical protein
VEVERDKVKYKVNNKNVNKKKIWKMQVIKQKLIMISGFFFIRNEYRSMTSMEGMGFEPMTTCV